MRRVGVLSEDSESFPLARRPLHRSVVIVLVVMILVAVCVPITLRVPLILVTVPPGVVVTPAPVALGI
ncbi:MAG: hypothetical protein ACHP8A_13380 [Terriglobales bacterium]